MQVVQSLADHFARGDQSGLLQHAQVLHHPEPRHRQLRLQLGERAAVALKEEVKQPPTAWIGEGAKNRFVFHASIIRDLMVTCQGPYHAGERDVPSARNIRPLIGVDIQLWSPTGAVGGLVSWEPIDFGLRRANVETAIAKPGKIGEP